MRQTNKKNLIFDLGNVIIDINLHLAMESFAGLANKDAEELKQKFWSAEFFLAHETGYCSDADFRKHVCDLLQKDITEDELDLAWNSLLLDIPASRIELLKQLRLTHNIYLLSNTNAIHIKAVNKLVQVKFGIESLDELFDKTFYSHEVKKRKPHPEIYTHVLEHAGLMAEDCIFFDDMPANVEGAEKVGIQAVLIRPGQFTITDYFQNSI